MFVAAEFRGCVLMNSSTCESIVSSSRKVCDCVTLNSVGLLVSSFIALNRCPCLDILKDRGFLILLFSGAKLHSLNELLYGTAITELLPAIEPKTMKPDLLIKFFLSPFQDFFELIT